MTLRNNRRVRVLGVLALLTPAALTGCAAHTDAVQAPAGMKVGAPMSAAEQQAVDQEAAARAAKRNGQ